jgi:hypothetical protein
MQHVELEAEKTSDRDRDRGEQAHQDFQHSPKLRLPVMKGDKLPYSRSNEGGKERICGAASTICAVRPPQAC